MKKSIKVQNAARVAKVPPVDGIYVSADERRGKGRALRESVPRPSQAGWKPHDGRRDPVELLSESNTGRMPQLIPIRFGRPDVAVSFAF